jgi:Fic family protein
MSHYQFQVIQPFDAYNGIISRTLLYHILSDAEMDGVRFPSLSSSLYHHKDEYIDKLWSTQ